MIDLLYLAHNRLEFTHATLAAMARNTAWPLVRRVVLYDDGSVDGTRALLHAFALPLVPVPVEVRAVELGSPVAVMNHFLASGGVAPWFAKIDNDTMLPPGWLPTCLRVLEQNPSVDLLGLEAMRPVASVAGRREAQEAEFIGGIGLMRTEVFATSLPRPDGRFGFTAWQDHERSVRKAWIDPALPVCLLDRVPFDPWRQLSAQYVARGWQRPWDAYGLNQSALWDWWL